MKSAIQPTNYEPSFFPEAGTVSSCKSVGSAWMAVAGLLVLFALLRSSIFNAPLIRDEGEYAYAAQLLRHGQLPYEHAFLQKPPMVVYSYALAQMVTPQVFWAPRFLGFIFVAFATALLGYAARLEFGGGHALLAMWLFTPMVLLPGLDQYTANTEVFMLLPLAGVLALAAYARHNGSSIRLWGLAGVCGAISLGYKYTSAPILGCIFLFWAICDWRSSGNPGLVIKHLAAVSFAMVTTILLILLPFLLSDGGRHLWQCTVAFNSAYLRSSNFGLDRFAKRMVWFWQNWWLCCLLPLPLLFSRSGKVRFWLGLLAAACIATGSSYYSQYYVPLTLFWSVLCAVAIKQIGASVARSLPYSEATCVRSLTAIALLTLLFSDLPGLALWTPKAPRLNPVNPFPESLLIANRVSELTRPDDPVFVAGSEPQILYYARRFSPTRFVIMYPLMIPSPQITVMQKEAIRDLERRPPAVIARATAHTSWLRRENTPRLFDEYLNGLLEKSYERVGGYVLGQQTGAWVEPLPESDFALSTLVLYRRKNCDPGCNPHLVNVSKDVALQRP